MKWWNFAWYPQDWELSIRWDIYNGIPLYIIDISPNQIGIATNHMIFSFAKNFWTNPKCFFCGFLAWEGVRHWAVGRSCIDAPILWPCGHVLHSKHNDMGLSENRAHRHTQFWSILNMLIITYIMSPLFVTLWFNMWFITMRHYIPCPFPGVQSRIASCGPFQPGQWLEALRPVQRLQRRCASCDEFCTWCSDVCLS